MNQQLQFNPEETARLINQPESMEAARNCSTPPEVFWCISLYGVLTNVAQLCNVRQTNTCVLLAKNPSSHVLSRACFSRTSSLLCLLQWNVPSRVCLSLSPVSTSGKHSFMCLPQQNTIQHNWLSKEPLSFHFRFVSRHWKYLLCRELVKDWVCMRACMSAWVRA